MSLRERSETNRDVCEVSIHPVCIPYLLGTLALLDLFVFDNSCICPDRSGLRILIVDDDDDDNHLTLFALRYYRFCCI